MLRYAVLRCMLCCALCCMLCCALCCASLGRFAAVGHTLRHACCVVPCYAVLWEGIFCCYNIQSGMHPVLSLFLLLRQRSTSADTPCSGWAAAYPAAVTSCKLANRLSSLYWLVSVNLNCCQSKMLPKRRKEKGPATCPVPLCAEA